MTENAAGFEALSVFFYAEIKFYWRSICAINIKNT